MREMKDSGVAWIGEIPADWDVLPLKRLCSMQAGKNLISEQIKLSANIPCMVEMGYGDISMNLIMMASNCWLVDRKHFVEMSTGLLGGFGQLNTL